MWQSITLKAMVATLNFSCHSYIYHGQICMSEALRTLTIYVITELSGHIPLFNNCH